MSRCFLLRLNLQTKLLGYPSLLQIKVRLHEEVDSTRLRSNRSASRITPSLNPLIILQNAKVQQLIFKKIMIHLQKETSYGTKN
jgi:hypothetical protein